MMLNKYIRKFFGVVILLMVASCVKTYEPKIDVKDTNKIVVSGQLSDQEGVQSVTISVTSRVDFPKEIPLSNCTVKLIASDGRIWNYTEVEDGLYQLWFSNNELDLNLNYHIEVLTPEKQLIVSADERFYDCPEVDNLHFKYAEKYNELTLKVNSGLQFYIDFKGSLTDSRYYYYEVIETSEFHAPRPIEWWYDGVVHHEVPADYSKSLCWNTQRINDVFVLSTDNLSSNEYKMFSINFTSNQSQRLQHLYSLLVKQYSISKEAYIYWKQMRINMHQSGGLYNSQPIAVKGNMTNVDNPETDVLGYFMLGKVKERRFFIPPQPIEIIDNTCGKPAKLRFGLRDIDPIQYPAYLDGNQTRYFNSILDKGCVDCTSDGGSTTKPSYWP